MVMTWNARIGAELLKCSDVSIEQRMGRVYYNNQMKYTCNKFLSFQRDISILLCLVNH